MTMRMLVLLVAALGVLAAKAGASPFYLRYDAHETFPEQEGWTRYWQDPEGVLERSVDGEIFRLDTRGSLLIFDLYLVQSEAFDLLPGEELHINWRMETVETQTSLERSDLVLFVSNASTAFVELYLAPDFVSADEDLDPGAELFHAITAGTAHEYALITADMEQYDLFVDGALAFTGCFHHRAIIGPLIVDFGDAIIGRSSLSEWDYVEVRVIPEPGSAILLSVGLFARRHLT